MHYYMPMAAKILTYIILILALAGAIIVFSANYNSPWQHFTQQSVSFLNFRTDIPAPDHDFVYKDGKYFWPEGPFPSVLMMPFIKIFGANHFNQGPMQVYLIVALGYFLFRLSRLKKFNLEDSIFLILVFLLGSPNIWMILDSKSWFYAQVVAITFLTIFIFELETRRRWWILGFLEGALLATRPTAGFIILAILPLIYFENIPLKQKFTNLFSFLFFPVLSLILLGWYNYNRFGNPLDNGYGSNDIGGFQEPLREMGIFTIRHIPSNIYYYFIESFQPVIPHNANLEFPFIKFNVWGLSFFLVAPFFINCFKTLKNFAKSALQNKLLWMVVGLTLFTILCYYSPGWYQYGPRYTADFMPILFLLALNGLNAKLSGKQKLLIAVSCFVNVYMIYTRQFNLIPQ